MNLLANVNNHHTLTARLLHWTIAVVIGLLIITGLYIRNPLVYSFFASMDAARKLHFIFMFLLISGSIIRVYYTCLNRDYRQVFFRIRDFKQLPDVIKYYLFLRDSMPGKGRYNAGQKVIYNGWVLLIILQAATGFILYSPDNLINYSNLLGGPVMVRQIHFLITWIFIITIFVHMYMAFLSGWTVVKSMLTGTKENKTEVGKSLFLR